MMRVGGALSCRTFCLSIVVLGVNQEELISGERKGNKSLTGEQFHEAIVGNNNGDIDIFTSQYNSEFIFQY